MRVKSCQVQISIYIYLICRLQASLQNKATSVSTECFENKALSGRTLLASPWSLSFCFNYVEGIEFDTKYAVKSENTNIHKGARIFKLCNKSTPTGCGGKELHVFSRYARIGSTSWSRAACYYTMAWLLACYWPFILRCIPWKS